MPKTRLTVGAREGIRDLIIAHRFDAATLAAKKTIVERALEVHRETYASHADWIAAAPPGALPTTTMLYFFDRPSSDMSYGVGLEAPVPIFANQKRFRASPALDAAILAKEALEKDRREMRGKVLATLTAYRNFEDLLAAWPEAEVFIRKVWKTFTGYRPINLPVAVPGDLNSALDLPPHA